MKNYSTDFLIIGSGAAGMTAALRADSLGLKTLIIEKAPHYGGSTAMSGGGIWVPNNYVLKENGIIDTTESVVTYLTEITQGKIQRKSLRLMLKKDPRCLIFSEAPRQT